MAAESVSGHGSRHSCIRQSGGGRHYRWTWWRGNNNDSTGRTDRHDTLHSVCYLISVYPLSFAYAAGLCLLYLKWKEGSLWKWLAAPGRMALTNYIGHSVIGMFLFYGIGLGLGSTIGLLQTEITVLAVFSFQILFSRLWLSSFKFGSSEWVWRMLTYGKWLAIR